MLVSLLSTVALAAPCSVDVSQSAEALEVALDQVEPSLRRALPSLGAARPPRIAAGDDGVWVGLGFEREDCTLDDGTSVLVATGAPMPGAGSAITDRFGASDILVVGTHDPTRDAWDRTGFLAIVAHEWVHVHHAASDPAASDYRGQHRLARRFMGKPAFQTAAVQLAQVALASDGCDLSPVQERYEALVAQTPKRLRTTLRRWMFTEGVARFHEARVEAVLRETPERDRIRSTCTSISDGDFGYAVGCTVAYAIHTCDPDRWNTDMVGPFDRHFAR